MRAGIGALLAALLAVSPAAPPAFARAASEAQKPSEREKPSASRGEELDRLFEALRRARDQSEAEAVEQRIWSLWSHSGNPRVDRLLDEGTAAMAAGDLDTARARFNMVVAMAPDFAEGWNQRATLYYLAGEHERARADIARTLALEPRHFGALSGLALVCRAEGDERGELEALRRAVALDRFLPGARERIEELAEKLEGRGI